jgi:hypothetical protein
MNMKKLAFIALSFLLILPMVSADVLIPATEFPQISFPIVLIIEFVVFWLLSKTLFKMNLNPWKILLILFIANLITSAIGFIFPVLGYNLLLAFILSVIIESFVILLFFRKENKLKLFFIVLIVNILSYIALWNLPYLYYKGSPYSYPLES